METFSALLAICAGNSPVTGEFPTQRPATQSFDVCFFYLRLNKRFSKQSWGWWFETLSRPLWRHFRVAGLFVRGIRRSPVKSRHKGAVIGSVDVLFEVSLNKQVMMNLDSSFVTPNGDARITGASEWARWRLESPASRLIAQPFIQAQMKENIKAPRHWPLWGEFTGDRWISRTKDQ